MVAEANTERRPQSGIDALLEWGLMSAGRLWRAAATALSLVVACERPDSGEAAPPAASASAKPARAQPRMVTPPRISAEVAFDLVLTHDGALLVWAVGSEVRAQRLDAGGAPLGKPLKVAKPSTTWSKARTVEIAADARASRLGVAWVTRVQSRGHAWAAVFDLTSKSPAPAASLGGVALGDLGRRGHLAAARGDSAEFLVFARGLGEACADHPGRRCTQFGVREVSTAGAQPRRVPLSVPAACGVGIAAYATIAGRWFYAVCSVAEGAPTTTLFGIQFNPRYAEARQVLQGCTPLGATVLDKSVVLVGECAAGRSAVQVRRPAQPLDEFALSGKLECRLGRPQLRDAALAKVFDQPRQRLAPLLPARMAPAGARAVWTGVAVLVARWARGRARVERHECRAGQLTRVR